MASSQSRNVVTLATFKGGSGKSTLALALAVHYAAAGRHAALVDADPQRSIASMADAGPMPAGLVVVEDTRDRAGDTIARLARDHSPVLVDTAGFRNRTAAVAIAAADIVIVPVKPSPLDIRVAIETLQLVGDIGQAPERRGRPIRAALLLTMTTPGSVIARHVRAEIEGAGMPLLRAEMVNRVAYGEAAIGRTTPTIADPQGAAARDIAAIADEIMSL